MNSLRAYLIVGVFLGAATAARADAIIYNQPSNFPATGTTLYASQNDVGTGNEGFGNYATSYDNFTLGPTTTITDVHWQGGYFGSDNNPPTYSMNGGPYPVPTPISQFTITFWSDAGGQPGIALATNTVTLAQANETFVGLENNATSAIYNYSADLTTPFVAVGGTPYWISIVADLPLADPDELQWGWHTGTGGDGVSVQDFNLPPPYDEGNGRFVDPSDLAFALSSPATVPEPASLFVWGLVTAAGAGWRRWRRNRAAEGERPG